MRGGGGLLGGDEQRAAEDDGGFEHREIARCVRFEDQRAESAPFEEAFEDDGASEERAELRADGGDDGTDRCGQRMEPEHAGVRTALRARDAEELRASDIVESGARHASDLGGERKREETAREEETRDSRFRIARQRNDAKARGEREREHRCEREERRGRDGGCDAIDPSATEAEPWTGAEHGGGDAEERSEEHGETGELRGRKRRIRDACHGRGARAPDRLAEIEREEAFDETCILHDERFVEMEARTERGAFRFARLITENERGRIAREETEREEDESGECENDDRRFRRASEDDRGDAACGVHKRPFIRRRRLRP